MFRILKRRTLNEQVVLMEIDAPMVARSCKPGQFIMLRVDEQGERVPFTVAAWDRARGTVTIVFQIVGLSTQRMSELNEGDCLADFVGPLGIASHLEGLSRVAVVGGGLGCALAYPQAKALFEQGSHVDLIAGFRNKDLIILEEEMRAASSQLHLLTDDGSNGKKGFVTHQLQALLEGGARFDAVIAIGPLRMMQAVCELTRPLGLKTLVSMNSTMVDGTGMCGCCRLSVGGETKFACVDGPDFDGHLVDFEEAIRRGAMYRAQEQAAHKAHLCKLTGEVRENA